ncbi:hypothetical protein C4N9_08600 [Pararhodobacter marinus]|uniref:ABC transporter domain-containing protein n=1 Tax=Pararhodobacter marinus TaxID=2184063 RepID=A0A2U2CD30_9RHOB|nr:hypothetical protein [Pararhodobacter marinus]PWE29787.1 hypothetical protein C4N9_08600 [Pararhodobacter marinus]
MTVLSANDIGVRNGSAQLLEPLTQRSDAVSGGEMQRISLLRALLRRPAFLFAEEPTSRLDPLPQQKMIALLSDVAETEGTAILPVSHDLALVRVTADRVPDLDARLEAVQAA